MTARGAPYSVRVDDIVASGYDAFYSSWGRSPRLRAIWRDKVTGPDFPDQFAHISFLRLAELRALCDGLHLADNRVLVDLACGAGGPGLWAAQRYGACLIGIDVSVVATDRAAENAARLGLAARASFRQGSFERTGLDDGSADAAMSVDALQYAPSKARALAEIARVLRPDGILGFVAFELDGSRVSGLPGWGDDPVSDYRPLLEQAGFDVLAYRQLAGWRDQVVAGFEAIVAGKDALTAELGESAAEVLVLEASVTIELQPYLGHAFALARRR